jgi:acyl carrier protein
MNAALEQRVIETVATVLNMSVAELTADSGPESLAQWDSMTHLSLVLALESEFGLGFSDDDVTDMLSVGLICRIVEDRVSEDQRG